MWISERSVDQGSRLDARGCKVCVWLQARGFDSVTHVSAMFGRRLSWEEVEDGLSIVET